MEDSSRKTIEVTTAQIEIVGDEEHLGHDTDISGNHVTWYQGLRGRLLTTNAPFLIYSNNKPFSLAPLKLKNGHRYEIRFTGDLGTGVMAYNGKCISLDQIVHVHELMATLPRGDHGDDNR